MKQHWPILVIVAVTMACLSPELIPTPDLNDNVLHMTLINGMAHAIEQGQNPFDFWSPEIGLGQQIVKYYQPGAHAIVVALWLALFKLVPLSTVFMWVRFLSLALLPLTFYATCRLLYLPRSFQVAAAALCLLVSGDSFGIDLGSYVWAGHGLFPQAVATHFLLLTIGFGWRAIRPLTIWAVDTPKFQPVHTRAEWLLAAAALALTGWCNLLYGYVGAVTLCILTAMPGGFPKSRLRQLSKIAAVAGACAIPKLITWLSQPGAVQAGESGARAFMSDSYGATKVLHDLMAGATLDNGRVAVLTILAAVGTIEAIIRHKKSPIVNFILTAGAAWLMLYFGRPFWGDALYLVGITPAMPLHRLIGPVQIFAVLLAAGAVCWIWEQKRFAYTFVALLLILAPVIQERRTYLDNNARWRTETRAAFAQDGPAIEQALQLAKDRGGRAYAGLPATWGTPFRIGAVPVYSLFPPRSISCVGYLYISFSARNTATYYFNDRRPADYQQMDVRTIIAPLEMPPLPTWTPIKTFGRFAVYAPKR